MRRCWPPIARLAAGATVRVRIPAREVILATRPPEGISLHNVLAGIVTAVHADAAFEHVMVQLAVGEVHLLAEVTRDAVTTLGITPGLPIQALIKSVSIDVLYLSHEQETKRLELLIFCLLCDHCSRTQ